MLVSRQVGSLTGGCDALPTWRREDGAPTAASFIGDAAFVVFISAVFWRTRFKYGQRGYRFVLLEAGHAMQNMLLCSEGLGLASCPIGGFYDSRINALVALDGVTEAVVYFACFGCRATVEADPS